MLVAQKPNNVDIDCVLGLTTLRLHRMWKFCLIALSLAIICKSQNIIDALPPQQEDEGGLKCERTPYIYRVTQTDENGKTCWDTIKVLACRGRCDSNEVTIILTSTYITFTYINAKKIIKPKLCSNFIFNVVILCKTRGLQLVGIAST